MPPGVSQCNDERGETEGSPFLAMAAAAKVRGRSSVVMLVSGKDVAEDLARAKSRGRAASGKGGAEERRKRTLYMHGAGGREDATTQ